MSSRDGYILVMCGVLFAIVWLGGCRTTEPNGGVQADEPQREARMENSIAGDDAERAKAALERDRRSGERRPATPQRSPVVDQPRHPR